MRSSGKQLPGQHALDGIILVQWTSGARAEGIGVVLADRLPLRERIEHELAWLQLVTTDTGHQRVQGGGAHDDFASALALGAHRVQTRRWAAPSSHYLVYRKQGRAVRHSIVDWRRSVRER